MKCSSRISNIHMHEGSAWRCLFNFPDSLPGVGIGGARREKETGGEGKRRRKKEKEKGEGKRKKGSREINGNSPVSAKFLRCPILPRRPSHTEQTQF
jgi:hypothetical protein